MTNLPLFFVMFFAPVYDHTETVASGDEYYVLKDEATDPISFRTTTDPACRVVLDETEVEDVVDFLTGVIDDGTRRFYTPLENSQSLWASYEPATGVFYVSAHISGEDPDFCRVKLDQPLGEPDDLMDFLKDAEAA